MIIEPITYSTDMEEDNIRLLSLQLCEAAKSGNLYMLNFACDHANKLGIEIKKLVNKEIGGLNALMWASFHGHPDCVTRLIELNTDVNKTIMESLSVNEPKTISFLGINALKLAICRNHTKIVEILLVADADPNILAHNEANTIQTAVLLAAESNNTAYVKLLLSYGAYTDTLNSSGWAINSPLMTAIHHQNHEMIDILLHAGAQVNARACKLGLMLPISYAASKGYVETVKKLAHREAELNNPDLNIDGDRNYSPLLSALKLLGIHHNITTEVIRLRGEPSYKVETKDEGYTFIGWQNEENWEKGVQIVGILLAAGADITEIEMVKKTLPAQHHTKLDQIIGEASRSINVAPELIIS